MRSYRGKWVAAIMGIALLLTPLSVKAADEVPPEVISSNVTPRVVAYQGNTTAGYTTVSVKTNEPTRGYVRVEGNARTARINLSTMDYKTDHVVNWVPWDDAKREPLPPGDYTLKLELQDQGLNSIGGYPIGKLTVVSESNPKALVDGITASPSEISPKYNVNESLTTIQYQLNRHAEVQVVIRKDGVEYFHGSKAKLAPGQYTFHWNGRNDEGKIVLDGTYQFVFKTIELNFNYPSHEQTITAMGSITVKDGEYYIPQWRMKEIVPAGSFDSPVISPNSDGNQDQVSGTFTLTEDVQAGVWITNEAGAHVNKVLPLQNLSAGTHSFTWDGKDFNGGTSPNGTYLLKVEVMEKGEAFGYIVMDGAQVRVQESHQITVPEPVQQVSVITPTTQMGVYPMGQGYTAEQGNIFPIIQFRSDADSYEVLVKEGVTGTVKVADVELMNLSAIPEKWGKVTRDGAEVRKSPSSPAIDKLNMNTELRILRQDGNWYRVLLSSGQQAYVLANDLTIVDKSTQETNNTSDSNNHDVEPIVHAVQSGDTLWKIAQKYGVTVDSIIKANYLDANQYLYIGQKLNIVTTAGTTQPVQEPIAQNVHVVQSGDTLWKIAQKYDVTVDTLVKTNNLDPNKYLVVGQKLVIPAPGTNPAPTSDTTVHVVQSGDTLWKIAQKYGVTVDALVKANNLDPNKYLVLGEKLVIPVSGTNPAPTNHTTVHVVQSGDALWKISQKYGVTVDALVKANNLDPNKYLVVGQKILIP